MLQHSSIKKCRPCYYLRGLQNVVSLLLSESGLHDNLPGLERERRAKGALPLTPCSLKASYYGRVIPTASVTPVSSETPRLNKSSIFTLYTQRLTLRNVLR